VSGVVSVGCRAELLERTVGELRLIAEDARLTVVGSAADGVSITWGKVSLHVTASSARASTPAGLIDLEQDGGFARLAGLVSFEEVPAA
jgi:hypothetical protein